MMYYLEGRWRGDFEFGTNEFLLVIKYKISTITF